MIPSIDLLVTAEMIHTLGATGAVEALAIRDGVVVATGSRADLDPLAGPNTRRVDLDGAHVVPGFIETHMHPLYAGIAAEEVDVTTPPHHTIESVIAAIRERAASTDPSVPIKSWGFDDTGVRDDRHMAAADLDAAAPDHLVFIHHISGHVAYVNSRVLRDAGITEDTPDPVGGRIERHEDGSPTGMLVEPSAMNLVRSVIDDYDYADFRVAARNASAIAARTGTTTITDMAVWEWDMFRAYQDAVAAEDLRVRVRLAPFLDFFDRMAFGTGFGNDRIKLGPIKMMADGSIQSYTACLTHPYHDRPAATGVAPLDAAQLEEAVAAAHARGHQVAIHTNGDEAIDNALDAIEAAIGTDPHRHRLEHFQTARPDQIARTAELGVSVSIFVNHIWFWGDRHIDRFLGSERANRLDPVREVADAGIRFGLHCDAPVTSLDPLFTMWCAVNRITSGGRPLGVDQSVDVATAFRGYTTDAAWLSYEDGRLGCLDPGHLADMAVLDRNPFTADPAYLRDVEVVRTIVGGETVFER